MMVGHKVTLNIERPEPVNPKPRLEVKGLTVEDRGRHRETERRFLYRETAARSWVLQEFPAVVRRSCWKRLRDFSPPTAGSITYIEENGTREELVGQDPRKIMDMGVSLSFVPEDRLGMGLVGDMDLTDNMMLRSFQKGNTPYLPTVGHRRNWLRPLWMSSKL